MANQTRTIADFSATRADGGEEALADRLGKVVLVVNVASKCGFTPQYAGLEALWRRYGEQGFEIIGFPCNQFGHQEPGDAGEIAQFCAVNYGVSFPVMAKGDVNGASASPLWQWLSDAARGIFGTRRVKWNFTKFLIGRDGRVIRRFAPTVTPEQLAAAIEAAL